MICELLTRHGDAHSGYVKRATPRCVRARIWKFNKYAKPRRETEAHQGYLKCAADRFSLQTFMTKESANQIKWELLLMCLRETAQARRFFLPFVTLCKSLLSLLLYSHNAALKKFSCIIYQGEIKFEVYYKKQ
jgi:hypothetical protein